MNLEDIRWLITNSIVLLQRGAVRYPNLPLKPEELGDLLYLFSDIIQVIQLTHSERPSETRAMMLDFQLAFEFQSATIEFYARRHPELGVKTIDELIAKLEAMKETLISLKEGQLPGKLGRGIDEITTLLKFYQTYPFRSGSVQKRHMAI